MLRLLPLAFAVGYHMVGKSPTCPPKLKMSTPAELPDAPDRMEVATAPGLSTPAVDPDAVHWPHSGPIGPPPPRGASEYELNRGRVVDALRRDYPNMFTAEPDFSIFREEIELHDPTGVRLRGIGNYKRIFDTLRFLRRTAMQDAELTYRLVATDGSVRVRWSAKIWARDPALGLHSFGGEPALFHLDGISAYDLDAKGLVKAHRLENIVMSGREHQTVTNLAFAWPVPGMATPELAIPFFKVMSAGARLREKKNGGGRSGGRGGPAFMMASGAADLEASEKAAREEKMAAVAEATAAAWREQRKAAGIADDDDEAKGGPFSNLFGGFGMPQACESSWDCDSPMVCCDLLVASVCCDGGLFIPVRQGPVGSMVPIPIPVEPDTQFPDGIPPQYPDSGGYRDNGQLWN